MLVRATVTPPPQMTRRWRKLSNKGVDHPDVRPEPLPRPRPLKGPWSCPCLPRPVGPCPDMPLPAGLMPGASPIGGLGGWIP